MSMITRHSATVLLASLMSLLATSAFAGVGGGSLVYGTLRGTEANELITDAVLLPDGDVAVCGWTDGHLVWDDAPGLQHIDKGGTEAFVAILSTDLQTVKAFTFLGGASDDKATAIAVNRDGNIYVAGTTESPNFPTTSGTIDPLYNANVDGFVTCFAPDLTKVLFSTYVGGSGNDRPYDMLLDDGGTIYLCGETTSSAGFPTNNGLYKTIVGNADGFVMRLSPNAAIVQFSTYFGGTSTDRFTSMVLDNSGTIVLTGSTSSADFPMFPAIDAQWWWYYKERPYDWTYNEGNADAVLTVLSQDGARAISSTYFGGGGMDEGVGVAIIEGTIYVLGSTTSPDMPTVSGLQLSRGGKSDMFLASFNDNGRTLTSCSYLGGTGDDFAASLSVYRQSSLLIIGNTTSSDFTTQGYQTSSENRGGTDGLVFIGNTSNRTYATTVGGSGNEQLVVGLALPNGGILATGSTDSKSIELSNTTLKGHGTPPTTDALAFQLERGGIDLGQPYGGERMCSGATLRFSWLQTEMDAKDTYEIQYSADNTVWAILAKGIVGNKFEWKVGDPVNLDNAYYFRVVSSRGHISTSHSTVRLDPQPTVTLQPQAKVMLCPDEPQTIRAGIVGSDLTLTWLKNGHDISGENADSLVVTNGMGAGIYSLRYMAACGLTGLTSECTVSIGIPAEITVQPLDDTVVTGGTITLTVKAKGSQLSYQWYHDDQVIKGATQANLAITNATDASAGSYYCVVSGPCNSVNTLNANVTVQNVSSVQLTDHHTSFAYPNPASNSVVLLLPSPLQENSVLIAVDAVGSEVARWNLSPNVTQLEVSVASLPPGMYRLIVGNRRPLQWLLQVIR